MTIFSLVKSFLKKLLYIWSEIKFDTIIQFMISSSFEKNYLSKSKFFQIFNDFIKCQNYVIIIINNQKNVKKIMNKFVIRCNKNEKQRISQIIDKRSKINIKRVDCFFKIFATLNENNKWVLKKIKKLKHNYVDVNEILYSMFWYYNITKQIKINIKQKYVFMRKSNEILIFLYVKYNTNSNNSQIIIKNVHNFIVKIRKKKLSNRISIQILHQIFIIDSNWFAKFQLNEFIDEIKYLFFINKTSTKMLTMNNEICIFDCIYKTNKYKMSLIIIIKITNFNISYYANICFMKNKKHENYCWFLKIIKKLYQKIDILFSFVWFFDDKSNIVIVFAIEISSNAKYTLYVWYIEKNVTNNCKKHFKNIVLWDKIHKQ